MKSILFVMLCLAFFFIGGMGSVAFFGTDNKKIRPSKNNHDRIMRLFDLYRPLFITLAVVSIIASYVHFYFSIKSLGWLLIASKEFEEAFGKGVLAHIAVLNRPAFIFLFADYVYGKRKSILILLILMFLSILVLQIKNSIISILLAGIFFAHFYRLIKVNWRKAFLYAGAVYLLFNLSYVIGFSRIGISHAYSSQVQSYLLNHFFTYLFAGPIGFSEILSNPYYPLYTFKEIFAVPINMYNTLVGNHELVGVIFNHWIPVSSIYRYFHLTNVFSIFGVLYMYIGPYGTLIYSFILGVVAYSIKVFAQKEEAFIGTRLVYAFLLSYLTISFFGLYFNMLILYEAPFFMLVIPYTYLLYKRTGGFVHQRFTAFYQKGY
jgi:oligosaccharide repeat unit polymerase